MTTYVDHTNGGVDVDIDDDKKAEWLLQNGYISKKTTSRAKDAGERGIFATTPPAKDDPTLAENREKPVPVSKIADHVANADDEGDEGETVHGKDMGLGADPGQGAPKVKVTSHKDAGTLPEGEEGASLKTAIEKDQNDVTVGTPSA